MEKEPLLQSYSKIPRTPSQLSHLTEENEISIPASLTPSDIKDTFVYPGESSSEIVDALKLRVNTDNPSDSPKPFASCSDSNVSSNPISVINPDLQIQIPQSWSVDPNYPFKKTNLYDPEICTINELDQPLKLKTQQLESSSIVRQWVVILIMYLSLGAVIYCSRENFVDPETHVAVDAL